MKKITDRHPKLKILLALLFLTIAGSVLVFAIPAVIRGQKVDVSIMVRMPHPYSDKVELYHNFDGQTKVVEMEKKNNYVFEYEGFENEGNHQFNILATTNKDHERYEWIGSEKGIYANSVTMNDNRLGESFLSNTNDFNGVGFNLNLVDSTVSHVAGESLKIDERVPAEMAITRHYVKHQLPPEGFSHAIPWMQALYTGENNDTAKIEVDYLKLYAVDERGEDVLLVDEYFYPVSSTMVFDKGRLFKRYPYFFDEKKYNFPMRVNTGSKGVITFYPHEYKQWVYHWWGSKRKPINDSTKYLRLEAMVKITGKAVVQAGIDFWRGENYAYDGLNANNIEAGASDLYFPSDQWQIISFTTKAEGGTKIDD